MLIYNDSTAGIPSDTSLPGDLKIDDMFFLKSGNGVRNMKLAPEAASGLRYFVPTVSGKVTLAIYSLQGEQLYKGLADVAAGKSYNVAQFARDNSKLPAGVIRCVQISGTGLNITAKMYQ